MPFTDSNDNLIIGADDQIIYTPAADAIGETSFSYQITDGSRVSDIRTGTVFVTFAPDIPSNFTTTQTIEVGQSIQSELNGSITEEFIFDRVTVGGIKVSERSSDPKDIFTAEFVSGKKPTK